MTARLCWNMPAGWAWKALSRSASTRRIGADHRRFGLSRKTRRARPCGASARNQEAKIVQRLQIKNATVSDTEVSFLDSRRRGVCDVDGSARTSNVQSSSCNPLEPTSSRSHEVVD